jgi:cytochrome c biogenesis protein CcdA
METVGTILALVWFAAMIALPFVLFALLWRKAGESLERRDRRQQGPRHAW